MRTLADTAPPAMPLQPGLQARSPAADRRIADIELLRAIAVIFVLLEHVRINLFVWLVGPETKFYTYFGFWNGVDLFFAISGFVIARSLLPSLEKTRDSTQFFAAALAFWIRRAFRLLPSAWLWLAVILAAALFLNRSGAFGPFRSNFAGAVAAILYIANFHIATIFGRSHPGAVFPYWSLSLEEQFYLVLPFLAFIFRRRLLLVLFIAVAAQFFIARTGAGRGAVALWLNQTRSDAISLGVLIAIWSRHPTYRLFEPTFLRNAPALRMAMLLFLILLLAAAGSTELDIVPFQVGVVAAISAVLVFIASFNGDYLWPPDPAKRLMLWVGSRSYAIYLVHIPAFFITREIWFRIAPPGTVFGPAYALRFGVTAAALIIVFADLNYRLVEIPLRRRGARIAARLAARKPQLADAQLA